MLQILLFSFPFQLTPSRRATKSGSVLVLQWEFQLTPSRRATSGFFSVALIVFNFNSRPHGGRPEETLKAAAVATISTHALTEGDVFSSVKSMHAFNFNSRPHGGRHMPDSSLFQCPQFQLTPSRRATDAPSILSISSKFQLTPSRRATGRNKRERTEQKISTHALTEGDSMHRPSCQSHRNFNSRPHGGRPIYHSP